MKVPHLRKKPEIKSCHNTTWEDNYSWIHQKNILEVLKDKNKLNPEVKRYLSEENEYTNHHLKDTKDYQKKLVDYLRKGSKAVMSAISHRNTVTKDTFMLTGFSDALSELEKRCKLN